jgi:hypothetical protein
MMAAHRAAMTPRYTWRSPREIAIFYCIAAALSAWVYLWDGQAFLLWGSQTAAYYFGQTTEATVVVVDVPSYVGVPSDDSEPTSGASGVFVDADGHSHTIFLQHASTVGQRVAVSYFPWLPGLAVERDDFERNPVVYLVFVTISGGILLLYWHFVLRHLLALRDQVKNDGVETATVVESN